MHEVEPGPALLGGALIGAAASLLLLTNGRTAGISGIFGSLLRRGAEGGPVRLAFLLGLLAGGAALGAMSPSHFASSWTPSLGLALAGGLLVGFGTQLGSGCTSGHGVCGVSRLSARSIVATSTFMVTGAATVFVMRYLAPGGPR